MEGLRAAIEVRQVDRFVLEFYAKRGQEAPDLES